MRVLVLFIYDKDDYVLQALRCGASGYLLKSVDLEELEVAIRAVTSGYRYLSTRLSERAITAYADRTAKLTRS